nr:hypothetical protein [Pandoravirus belohorizontensis]
MSDLKKRHHRRSRIPHTSKTARGDCCPQFAVPRDVVILFFSFFFWGVQSPYLQDACSCDSVAFFVGSQEHAPLYALARVDGVTSDRASSCMDTARILRPFFLGL